MHDVSAVLHTLQPYIVAFGVPAAIRFLGAGWRHYRAGLDASRAAIIETVARGILEDVLAKTRNPTYEGILAQVIEQMSGPGASVPTKNKAVIERAARVAIRQLGAANPTTNGAPMPAAPSMPSPPAAARK